MTANASKFSRPHISGEGSNEQTADKTPGNECDARHVLGARHRSIIRQDPGYFLYFLDRSVHNHEKEKEEKINGRIGAGSVSRLRSIGGFGQHQQEIEEEQEVGHELRQLGCHFERRVDERHQ